MPRDLRKSLFQQIFLELGNVPKLALVWAAFSAMLGEVLAFFGRGGDAFSRLNIIGLAVDLPIYLVASYVVVTSMMRRPPSLRGALAFGATTLIAIGVPLVVLLGGLSAIPKGGDAPLLILLLAGLVLFSVLIPLLAAWPIVESLSRSVVGPWRIVRATRGGRWDLIIAAYVTTGLNRLVPPLSKAHSESHVILFAAGHAIIDFLSLLIVSSIAVAAWKFSLSNDPTLADGVAAA